MTMRLPDAPHGHDDEGGHGEALVLQPLDLVDAQEVQDVIDHAEIGLVHPRPHDGRADGRHDVGQEEDRPPESARRDLPIQHQGDQERVDDAADHRAEGEIQRCRDRVGEVEVPREDLPVVAQPDPRRRLQPRPFRQADPDHAEHREDGQEHQSHEGRGKEQVCRQAVPADLSRSHRSSL